MQVEFGVTCRYQPHLGAALAQLVRALDCGSRGPPFEPGRWYHLSIKNNDFRVVWIALSFGPISSNQLTTSKRDASLSLRWGYRTNVTLLERFKSKQSLNGCGFDGRFHVNGDVYNHRTPKRDIPK